MKTNLKKLPYIILPLILVGLVVQLTPDLAQGTPAHRVTDPALNVGRAYNVSHNWAGYITTGGTFTSVRGSWVVPQVNATGTSADATWVGIGGITSNDLIQIGTQAMVNNGKVSYQAWYEMLPANSHKIPLTISPDDSINASVIQQSANQWTISLNDITTGQDYQTNVTYTSSLSSAEWIEEMPVQGRFFIPLDNFGSMQFSGMATVKDGTELTPAQASAVSMAMVNNLDQVVAQPSALGSDGASFTITRTTSESGQSVSHYGKSGWRRISVHSHQPFHRQGRGRYSSGYEQRFDD